ncbi:hypothetical protein PVL29_009716 [Vitis rotundifolia]|uniref:Uncharacterized protein n=1 Tax=Vitis rotundifolia TaxID=103349 RepID=A0AA39DSC8_VITRO|nr:hypothetical protein PVL29_009716 [Vitis rotundifolia]
MTQPYGRNTHRPDRESNTHSKSETFRIKFLEGKRGFRRDFRHVLKGDEKAVAQGRFDFSRTAAPWEKEVSARKERLLEKESLVLER